MASDVLGIYQDYNELFCACVCTLVFLKPCVYVCVCVSLCTVPGGSSTVLILTTFLSSESQLNSGLDVHTQTKLSLGCLTHYTHIRILATTANAGLEYY